MNRKNLLITGASKGLGQEIKNYYLNKDYNLINLSRSKLKNKSNLVNISNDLTNSKKTISTFKKIKKKYKKLDAIICCTGSGKISNDELNKDIIQHYLDLNLFTIINTVNSYLKIYKHQSTKIVIISSIVSKKLLMHLLDIQSLKEHLIILSKFLLKSIQTQKSILILFRLEIFISMEIAGIRN